MKPFQLGIGESLSNNFHTNIVLKQKGNLSTCLKLSVLNVKIPLMNYHNTSNVHYASFIKAIKW